MVVQVPASSRPAVVAGRYELGPLLGRGGMADVYRATDLALDRPVALKMLRDSTGDETDRVRFTGEGITLAQLSHRGLVTLLDAGLDDDRPFIVLELVEGLTLARTLASSGPLRLEAVRNVGAQLADALAYAHSRGVVHRDVKPGNVLLGPQGRVKLADFGIARLVGDHVRHTRTGEAIGTAAYLAPEQVTGGEIGTAVDTYSLGLLLLEALTGEPSYPGTPAEAALARLSRPPVIPSWLPAEFRALVAEMTRLDPDARPGAADVAARLRGHATSPVAARETVIAGVSRPAWWSARLPVAAALVALLGLLVTGAVAGRTPHGPLATSHVTEDLPRAASIQRATAPIGRSTAPTSGGRPTASPRPASTRTPRSATRHRSAPRGHSRPRVVHGRRNPGHRPHPKPRPEGPKGHGPKAHGPQEHGPKDHGAKGHGPQGPKPHHHRPPRPGR